MSRLRYPALPKIVHGAGGPIRVRLIKRVATEEGDAAWGTWEPATRTIRLERGAKLEHKWRVLYHETMHAAIDDAGLCHLLTEEAQETLCDAVASSRMAELRASLTSR